MSREKRQGGQDPNYYRITDSTNISRVSMKKLLSHTRTKMELTYYVVDKAFKHFRRQSGRRFLVAWGSECKATFKDVGHLQSNQEEADTKIILHAFDVTSDGAMVIHVHSPDTDVFVLALRAVSRAVQQCFICYRKGAQPQSNQARTNSSGSRGSQDICSSRVPCTQWSR